MKFLVMEIENEGKRMRMDGEEGFKERFGGK